MNQAQRPGTRQPVATKARFPYGLALASAIAEAEDFETKRQALDKVTGKPVWTALVLDMNPEVTSKSQKIFAVKIAADVRPSAPSGGRVDEVEFEDFRVTYYVDSRRCKGQGDKCRADLGESFWASGIVKARDPKAGA
jgi:hypothetical protein